MIPFENFLMQAVCLLIGSALVGSAFSTVLGPHAALSLGIGTANLFMAVILSQRRDTK